MIKRHQQQILLNTIIKILIKHYFIMHDEVQDLNIIITVKVKTDNIVISKNSKNAKNFEKNEIT